MANKVGIGDVCDEYCISEERAVEVIQDVINKLRYNEYSILRGMYLGFPRNIVYMITSNIGKAKLEYNEESIDTFNNIIEEICVKNYSRLDKDEVMSALHKCSAIEESAHGVHEIKELNLSALVSYLRKDERIEAIINGTLTISNDEIENTTIEDTYDEELSRLEESTVNFVSNGKSLSDYKLKDLGLNNKFLYNGLYTYIDGNTTLSKLISLNKSLSIRGVARVSKSKFNKMVQIIKDTTGIELIDENKMIGNYGEKAIEKFIKNISNNKWGWENKVNEISKIREKEE